MNKLKDFFTKKNITFFVIALPILCVIIWIFLPSRKPIEVVQNEIKEKREEKEIAGVSDVVDPRENWINTLESKIKELQEAHKKEMQNELDNQKKLFEQQLQEMMKALANEKLAKELENIEKSKVAFPTNNMSTGVKTKSLVKISASQDNFALDEQDYLISGAFVDAVLMTGIDVSTGTVVKGDPKPIMLRLTDVAKFSRDMKTDQVVDAIILGSCTGNLSSERAECRLETLSLKNRDGVIIEKKVEGWVVGSDGRIGIRGKIVDRAGPMVQMSVLNGFLGGVSNFFKQQSLTSVYPITPLGGQTNALEWKDSLKSGGAEGISSALDRLAKYSIDRAEQLSPTVIVDAGVKVQLLFKTGVRLKSEEEKNVSQIKSVKNKSINVEEIAQ